MGWESPGGGYMLRARNIYPIMNIWSRWLFGQRKVCPLLNITWWEVLYLPVSSWLDTLWPSALSNPIVTNLILKQNLLVVSLAKIWKAFELCTLITWWPIDQFLLHWPHSLRASAMSNQWQLFDYEEKNQSVVNFANLWNTFQIWSQHLLIGCESVNIVPWQTSN